MIIIPYMWMSNVKVKLVTEKAFVSMKYMTDEKFLKCQPKKSKTSKFVVIDFCPNIKCDQYNDNNEQHYNLLQLLVLSLQ